MKMSDLPSWPDMDIGKAFSRFVDETFVKYRGCLLLKGEKEYKGQYKWNDKWYPSLDSAKGAIDQSFIGLSESLNVNITIQKEGHEIELGKEHTDQFFVGKSPYTSFKESEELKREGK
jgi:hypothetical protein